MAFCVSVDATKIIPLNGLKKVKSAFGPSGPSGRILSRFP